MSKKKSIGKLLENMDEEEKFHNDYIEQVRIKQARFGDIGWGEAYALGYAADHECPIVHFEVTEINKILGSRHGLLGLREASIDEFPKHNCKWCNGRTIPRYLYIKK